MELDNEKSGIARLAPTGRKENTRKVRFDFLGDFVLTEELGDGAGQREKRNRPHVYRKFELSVLCAK